MLIPRLNSSVNFRIISAVNIGVDIVGPRLPSFFHLPAALWPPPMPTTFLTRPTFQQDSCMTESCGTLRDFRCHKYLLNYRETFDLILIFAREKNEEWRARRGSNPRPNAPEAFALSI